MQSHTFVYDLIGMDVGYENPVFACLELDYEDVDEDPTGETLEMMSQTLTFYELDLGPSRAGAQLIPASDIPL